MKLSIIGVAEVDDNIPEHAVLIYIKLLDKYSGTESERQAIFTLEDELISQIDENSVGEFNGDSFGDGFCTLYMYGPSADILFDAIAPVLKKFSLPSNSYIIKRYGEPGDREERVSL